MKPSPLHATLLASTLLMPLAVASTTEASSANTKPLSAILDTVESLKAGVVTEAEYEHKFWEIKVCEQEGCQKIYIDPATGGEKRRAKSEPEEIPPGKAPPLSTIIRSMEAQGWNGITEVEFEYGFWEIEGYKGSDKRKLKIDPLTGK